MCTCVFVSIASVNRRIQCDQVCLEAILLAVPRFDIDWKRQVGYPFKIFMTSYFRLRTDNLALEQFQNVLTYDMQSYVYYHAYGRYVAVWKRKYVTLGRGKDLFYAFNSRMTALQYYNSRASVKDWATKARRMVSSLWRRIFPRHWNILFCFFIAFWHATSCLCITNVYYDIHCWCVEQGMSRIWCIYEIWMYSIKRLELQKPVLRCCNSNYYYSREAIPYISCIILY